MRAWFPDLRPATSVLQLRIALRGLSPPVWRRVLIPEHITPKQLHDVIQAVMGWTDEHLHQFLIGGQGHGEAPRGRSAIFHDGYCADAGRICSARVRGHRLAGDENILRNFWPTALL
ncbi:plasmid pRiA4b ORF-3 family protein [Cupriavidus basilensis]